MLRDHVRQDGRGDIQDALEIDVDHLLPFVGVESSILESGMTPAILTKISIAP